MDGDRMNQQTNKEPPDAPATCGCGKTIHEVRESSGKSRKIIQAIINKVTTFGIWNTDEDWAVCYLAAALEAERKAGREEGKSCDNCHAEGMYEGYRRGLEEAAGICDAQADTFNQNFGRQNSSWQAAHDLAERIRSVGK